MVFSNAGVISIDVSAGEDVTFGVVVRVFVQATRVDISIMPVKNPVNNFFIFKSFIIAMNFTVFYAGTEILPSAL